MSQNGEKHYSKNEGATSPAGGGFLLSRQENITETLDEQIKESRLKEAAEGVGPKARSARHKIKRRNHPEINTCPEGHTYNDQNTLYNAAGSRYCLRCLRDRRIYQEDRKTGEPGSGRQTEQRKT